MQILIVDDHQLFIDGIWHIIETLDSKVVILEATSADGAMQHLDTDQELDLILLDLRMAGLNGRSVMQHRRIHDESLPIVIISGEDDLPMIKSVIDAGVAGLIPKSYSGQNLLDALRSILDGKVHIPETIRKQLLRLPSKSAGQQHRSDCGAGPSITRRQHDVLKLIANGHSNKQISSELFLTENTVKAHVSALLKALGASNRTECASIARGKGLIV